MIGKCYCFCKFEIVDCWMFELLEVATTQIFRDLFADLSQICRSVCLAEECSNGPTTKPRSRFVDLRMNQLTSFHWFSIGVILCERSKQHDVNGVYQYVLFRYESS